MNPGEHIFLARFLGGVEIDTISRVTYKIRRGKGAVKKYFCANTLKKEYHRTQQKASGKNIKQKLQCVLHFPSCVTPAGARSYAEMRRLVSRIKRMRTHAPTPAPTHTSQPWRIPFMQMSWRALPFMQMSWRARCGFAPLWLGVAV